MSLGLGHATMRKSFTFALSLTFVINAYSVGAEPPAAMRSLDYFKGTWACTDAFPSSGKTIASDVGFVSDLEGSAIVKHHDDTQPNLYHAIEAWGYDAQAKQFNATVLDNFGGARRFSSEGWKDNEMSWASAADVTPAQRFLYTRFDSQRYRVDWMVAKGDNNFVVGDTLTCQRK